MKDCEGHEPQTEREPYRPEDRACKAYVALTNGSNDWHESYLVIADDLRDAIIDLLADLRHLCDVEGLDFSAINRRSYLYYRQEPKFTKRRQ
ncbi:MAG TPA: hypothetical protein VIH18_10810 [Candidatus Binatia bacterium]|jgi:hypothetical protein